MAQPVEAVAAQTGVEPLVRPAERACRVGHGGVERGVEARDVRQIRKLCPRRADTRKAGFVVERRELGECVDVVDDVRVDHNRFDELRTAMDDSVPDGSNAIERGARVVERAHHRVAARISCGATT